MSHEYPSQNIMSKDLSDKSEIESRKAKVIKRQKRRFATWKEKKMGETRPW